ncbi:MAG: hypothetical protein JXR76_27325 [Deltaproteobacteria bacterium]|nr:hypothetical protein [Deltaproteobacteria bacterium]
MAVKNVNEYNYQFHGGPNGYQGNRCILRLNDGNTSVAYVYFVVDGKPIPSDTETSRINMYMPESAIDSVIDMLRNEKPLQIYYASGSAFFKTGDEPVGEEES